MGKGFRYGRRPDVKTEKKFSRAHSGKITTFHNMNMAINIGGLLIPCDQETYRYIRKNFKVGDVVAVTMFPWGQIKTIKHLKGPNDEK